MKFIDTNNNEFRHQKVAKPMIFSLLAIFRRLSLSSFKAKKQK
jgi:hypothetical protein